MTAAANVSVLSQAPCADSLGTLELGRSRREAPAAPPRMKPSSYDRGKTQAQRDAAYRDTILECAIRLYAEEGYSALTVAALERTARISRRTIFALYPSLDDVRLAVWERAIAASIGRVVQVAEAAAPEDRLEALLRDLFAVAATTPALGRACMHELMRPEPRNLELRVRVRDFVVSSWRAANAADVAAGRRKHRVDELTIVALYGSLLTLFAHCLDHPEAADEAVATVLALLRGRYPT